MVYVMIYIMVACQRTYLRTAMITTYNDHEDHAAHERVHLRTTQELWDVTIDKGRHEGTDILGFCQPATQLYDDNGKQIKTAKTQDSQLTFSNRMSETLRSYLITTTMLFATHSLKLNEKVLKK